MEIGLRILFCPLGSNIVVRTASCSIGVALPVYSTFKAIEQKDQDEQRKWLMYWAAYGSFSMVEMFTDKLLHWCPPYYYLKFAFLVWLQLPTFDGAKLLYMNHLRPFLSQHQARLDRIVGLFYGEMSRVVSLRQEEYQFVKALVMKILASDTTRPGQGQASGAAIEGPSSEEDSGSEDDDH